MSLSRKGNQLIHADDVSAAEIARKVLEVEAHAILDLKEHIGHGFLAAVRRMLNCKGKVVVSGVGKSGYVARKIASTLSSTGTPAFFVHPAEGIHGELGMVSKEDIFLFISHSGETEEIIRLLPFVKRCGCPIISITGGLDSILARNADVLIPVEITQEACPLGLAPTASTTATMAMGDALAVALLQVRGFTRSDFGRLHPGGTLGRKLLLKVCDLMHTGDAVPIVDENTLMREAIFEITTKTLGVTGVINERGELAGVITDGDLRRGLEKGDGILDEKAKVLMTCHPKWIHKEALAVDALNQMQNLAITSLFVFDSERQETLEGIIHLHDLLRAGVV
jgi:arabinose-5-phosphate isomerase